MPDTERKVPVVLVTGDYVQDVFIYTGQKATPGAGAVLGTRHFSTDGGVCLIRDILEFSKEKPPKKKEQETENTGRAVPELHYQLRLGLNMDFSVDTLPEHLRSYAIWHPFRKTEASGEKGGKVWRFEKTPPGYGMDPSRETGGVESGRGGERDSPWLPSADVSTREDADIVILDDAGLMIRHEHSRSLWPAFLNGDGNPPKHIILKMSHPLAEGALWEALEGYRRDKLIAIAGINDVRRMEAGVSRCISWERSALELIRELNAHPRLAPLLECRHLIVNFRSEGALWVKREGHSHRYCLLFDPRHMEGESAAGIHGGVFGFQSCLAASLAHWMAVNGDEEGNENQRPEGSPVAMGICGGLRGMHTLLKEGHGSVWLPDDSPEGRFPRPGFPAEEIAGSLSKKESGYALVEIPPVAAQSGARGEMNRWSILSHQYTVGANPDGEGKPESFRPLYGLGMLTARFGDQALLNNAPVGVFGKMITVDRTEIESLRNLARLIERYERERKQEKPLSIAVFGAPGSGKSFGVKQIARSFLGRDVPILVFNLSQFRDPDELIGAFHQVRDKVLEGKTPFVFWDEFDSREYFWLQYLLAPMQDGAFQDGQITHPIGKCVFVFAGATSYTLDHFGPMNPESPDYPGNATEEQRKEDAKAWREFQLKKGPDFVSRLHGFINITGPNPRHAFDPNDRMWKIDKENPDEVYPIRRALILRSQLRVGRDEELRIDHGLLAAFLRIGHYRHGARSMERVVQSLGRAADGQFYRAELPAPELLDRLFDEEGFHRLMQRRNPFKSHPDIDRLAAAVHDNYRRKAKENGWPIKPEVDMDYKDLTPGYKEANRQAALRMPEILELIDLYVADETNVPEEGRPLTREELLERLNVPETLELMAQAEHLLWRLERKSRGWRYDPIRNDKKKRHPDMVDWYVLSSDSKNKDRENILAYPDILELAGCVAVAARS